MQGVRSEIYTEKTEACRESICLRMNIIDLAFDMTRAVEVFIHKVRRFFYHVMLLGYRCPRCSNQLNMIAEGKCKCSSCGHEFDPTEEFQRCAACDGKIKLRVRRYQCQDCGQDVRSRFLFDGLIFDTEYFKAKMAESRQRKQEQRERVRQMLAESRSANLPLEAADLNSVPGLLEALNSLTTGFATELVYEAKTVFDLNRYERHIMAHIQDFPVGLREIPPLSENPRKDLVWRFIAIIFLAHNSKIDIWQEGQMIWVKKRETDREGQDLSGEFEEADGIQGSVGGTEAG